MCVGTSRYSFTHDDNGYYIEFESCEGASSVPELERIIRKYPKIINISYGWDASGSYKPPFKVENSVGLLYKIWKHIGQINAGDYLLMARSPKILSIYTRRWLFNKKNIVVLEGGKVRDTYCYVVMRKTT